MTSDAASRPDELPAGSDDEFFDGVWGDDSFEPDADPAAANLFSAEIENVDASEWDVDTALIWGDDGADAVGGGTESMGFDLPI